MLLFCILLVFYLFGKMSAILHRNPKFALFEKFFSRLERKEFWLSKNIQIWQGDYKIAKKFQSMLVRNASFDAIDLGLICPCYSSRSMYVMHISSSMILFGGRSKTTWTKFWPFLTTYLPICGHLVHYLPLVHVDIETPDHLCTICT